MRVAIIGFGEMGRKTAQLISTKEGVTIAGVVDVNPALHGKPLSEFFDSEEEVVINKDLSSLKDAAADIAVVTTGSEIKKVYGTIMSLLDMNLNVLTIAEEMSYPWVKNRELSDAIDEKAKDRGVSVLGTGINPGFILDTLIIVLTSVSFQVDKVRAVRVNDLSPYGPTVLNSQGVFQTEEGFRKGVENGDIVGHVGFSQSVALMAEAFGWKIDHVIEEKEPIIAKVRRPLKDKAVEEGMVAGCNHKVTAKEGGKVRIELEHPQQVHPGVEGINTKDEIAIEGTPDLHMTINPEIPGGVGTVAMAVNMLPLVLKGKAGLMTMRDVPELPSIFKNSEFYERKEG